MTTTIQIDDNIKKQLFKIKLKLEEQKGSAVTYNEIIEFLIKHQKTNIIKKKNMKEFRRFEGILPSSTLEEYLEEKKKELEREELRAPLKKT
jgi:hypothetical protein